MKLLSHCEETVHGHYKSAQSDIGKKIEGNHMVSLLTDRNLTSSPFYAD